MEALAEAARFVPVYEAGVGLWYHVTGSLMASLDIPCQTLSLCIHMVCVYVCTHVFMCLMCIRICVYGAILAGCMSTWHKLELSEGRELGLRKCLPKTGLHAVCGVFSESGTDVGGPRPSRVGLLVLGYKKAC